jgi:hypothetical protein
VLGRQVLVWTRDGAARDVYVDDPVLAGMFKVRVQPRANDPQTVGVNEGDRLVIQQFTVEIGEPARSECIGEQARVGGFPPRDPTTAANRQPAADRQARAHRRAVAGVERCHDRIPRERVERERLVRNRMNDRNQMLGERGGLRLDGAVRVRVCDQSMIVSLRDLDVWVDYGIVHDALFSCR